MGVCIMFVQRAMHKVFLSVFLYCVVNLWSSETLLMGFKTAPPLVQRVKYSC